MTDSLQLFPALPQVTQDALRASIQRFGVLIPVVTDQQGRILDGHHRARIARELDVGYDTITIHVGSEDEAREIARTLNADRRQLTPEQRQEVAVALRQEGHSYRAIAGALGTSEPTVRRDLHDATASGDAVLPDRIIGLDGKSRPATRDLASMPEGAQVWTPWERARRQAVEDHGFTTVAHLQGDAALVAWAAAVGKLLRIDRTTKWGNPFALEKDGDRDYVIDSFGEHYLPRKPSLLAALPELKGHVLGCWCLPERCHGEVLLEAVDRLGYECLIEILLREGLRHAD